MFAHHVGWPSRYTVCVPAMALVWVANTTAAGPAIPAACLAFENYPSGRAFTGPYAKPQVNTPAQVRRFRSVIREGAKGAPDFAGYLRLVQWGCGTDCHAFALVDKRTGRVHRVPETAALGASYRLTSRLFVMDPPDMHPDDSAPLAATRSYVWNEMTETLDALPHCDGEAQPDGHELGAN